MSSPDKRLRNELLGVIVLKAGLLSILWLIFVHGARVSVDAGGMAQHVIPPHEFVSQGGLNAH